MQERGTGQGTNGGQLRFFGRVDHLARFTQIDVRVGLSGCSTIAYGGQRRNRTVVLPVWVKRYIRGLDVEPDGEKPAVTAENGNSGSIE